MENNQDSNINEIQEYIDDLDAKLEKKKEDLVSTLSSDEFLNKKSKQQFEIIGDLFYKSIKNFFDIGFKLAKNLNLEFLTDEKKGTVIFKKE
ncbi:MAG: hypothetical protein ACFE8M_10695 [Candidatus Hermodarchaeota archaeon]